MAASALPYSSRSAYYSRIRGHSQEPADRDPDKATWWGCGRHVPKVMDSVPEEDRCSCAPRVERDGKEYPPMGNKAD